MNRVIKTCSQKHCEQEYNGVKWEHYIHASKQLSHCNKARKGLVKILLEDHNRNSLTLFLVIRIQYDIMNLFTIYASNNDIEQTTFMNSVQEILQRRREGIVSKIALMMGIG